MYLGYLDESGNTGRRLDDADQPILWMVAVLVPEDEVHGLTLAADKIMAKCLPSLPTHEIHAQELFAGAGPWRDTKPKLRIKVMRKTLALLAKHDCAVVHASIDKPRLAARNYEDVSPPQMLALQFLTEKIDRYVVRLRDPLRSRVLLIADESKENERIAKEMIHRQQRIPYGEVPGRTLKSVIDTIHFVRSEESRCIQVADTVGFVLNRHDRFKREKSKGDSAKLFQEFNDTVDLATVTWRQRWPSE